MPCATHLAYETGYFLRSPLTDSALRIKAYGMKPMSW